jgi:aspartyl-tRNA(Asn)/glutamyl-tRNA(Gln) amidotransferase subunit B
VSTKFAEIIHKDKELLSVIEKYKDDKEIQLSKLASFLVNKKISLDSDIKASFVELTKVGDTDQTSIKSAIDLVLSNNASAVADYKSGKTNVIGFLVGQVMRQTGGKSDPKTVNNLLAEALKPLNCSTSMFTRVSSLRDGKLSKLLARS